MKVKRLVSFSEGGFKSLLRAAKRREISFSELIRRITDEWIAKNEDSK